MATRRNLPHLNGFGSMAQCLGLRFSFAGAAFLQAYSDLLEPLSLTPGRVLALSFIHEHQGCEQRTLAEGIAVNEASAMLVVNTLEALELVQRLAGRNRRAKALHLTPAGDLALARALEAELVLTQQTFKWMGSTKLESFMTEVDEVLRRATAFSHEITQNSAKPT